MIIVLIIVQMFIRKANVKFQNPRAKLIKKEYLCELIPFHRIRWITEFCAPELCLKKIIGFISWGANVGSVNVGGIPKNALLTNLLMFV